MSVRQWKGRWIGEGRTMVAHTMNSVSAPLFRRKFVCGDFKNALLYFCSPGYHEVYVNGRKVGNEVLTPAPTRFDMRLSYIEYDLSDLLKPGENVIAVMLGNGWYNCHSTQHWSFDKAPWRDYPKFLCDLVIDGETVLKSDVLWKMKSSPVTFDALRSGEYYDARLETPGFAEPGASEEGWRPARAVLPPGGIIEKVDIVPCRIKEVIEPCSKVTLYPNSFVFDFGKNITGWTEISVEGEAGAAVYIKYSEKVRSNGDIDTAEIASCIEGAFQHDRYTLKGGSSECWHPRFTYHGFRYVWILLVGNVRLTGIKAHFIHSDFDDAGSFSSSSAVLNKLQAMTRLSYLDNFTGIPTDCPHREKNGWTGDTNMACRTGLWNFDSRCGYIHFMRIMADCQRINGQFSCIAPTGGYGYNWGSGPVFDSMIFEGCRRIWEFYGDSTPIEEFYGNMARYIEFCCSMANDNIISFGLGDWAHPEGNEKVPLEIVSTAFFIGCIDFMADFARITGRDSDEEKYRMLAGSYRRTFQEKFCRADGSCGDDSPTALAIALYFKLALEPEKTADKLAKKVKSLQYKAFFGIVGARLVPRMLAKYGYAEAAFEVVTQDQCPGWGYWVKSGATTLWEHWNGCKSQTHIMYGDVSAWMYEYLAGITPAEPGFSLIRFAPCFVPQLDEASAVHRIAAGEIRSGWKRCADGIHFECCVPAGCRGVIDVNGKRIEIGEGIFKTVF